MSDNNNFNLIAVGKLTANLDKTFVNLKNYVETSAKFAGLAPYLNYSNLLDNGKKQQVFTSGQPHYNYNREEPVINLEELEVTVGKSGGYPSLVEGSIKFKIFNSNKLLDSKNNIKRPDLFALLSTKQLTFGWSDESLGRFDYPIIEKKFDISYEESNVSDLTIHFGNILTYFNNIEYTTAINLKSANNLKVYVDTSSFPTKLAKTSNPKKAADNLIDSELQNYPSKDMGYLNMFDNWNLNLDSVNNNIDTIQHPELYFNDVKYYYSNLVTTDFDKSKIEDLKHDVLEPYRLRLFNFIGTNSTDSSKFQNIIKNDWQGFLNDYQFNYFTNLNVITSEQQKYYINKYQSVLNGIWKDDLKVNENKYKLNYTKQLAFDKLLMFYQNQASQRDPIWKKTYPESSSEVYGFNDLPSIGAQPSVSYKYDIASSDNRDVLINFIPNSTTVNPQVWYRNFVNFKSIDGKMLAISPKLSLYKTIKDLSFTDIKDASDYSLRRIFNYMPNNKNDGDTTIEYRDFCHEIAKFTESDFKTILNRYYRWLFNKDTKNSILKETHTFIKELSRIHIEFITSLRDIVLYTKNMGTNISIEMIQGKLTTAYEKSAISYKNVISNLNLSDSTKYTILGALDPKIMSVFDIKDNKVNGINRAFSNFGFLNYYREIGDSSIGTRSNFLCNEVPKESVYSYTVPVPSSILYPDNSYLSNREKKDGVNFGYTDYSNLNEINALDLVILLELNYRISNFNENAFYKKSEWKGIFKNNLSGEYYTIFDCILGISKAIAKKRNRRQPTDWQSAYLEIMVNYAENDPKSLVTTSDSTEEEFGYVDGNYVTFGDIVSALNKLTFYDDTTIKSDKKIFVYLNEALPSKRTNYSLKWKYTKWTKEVEDRQIQLIKQTSDKDNKSNSNKISSGNVASNLYIPQKVWNQIINGKSGSVLDALNGAINHLRKWNINFAFSIYTVPSTDTDTLKKLGVDSQHFTKNVTIIEVFCIDTLTELIDDWDGNPNFGKDYFKNFVIFDYASSNSIIKSLRTNVTTQDNLFMTLMPAQNENSVLAMFMSGKTYIDSHKNDENSKSALMNLQQIFEEIFKNVNDTDKSDLSIDSMVKVVQRYEKSGVLGSIIQENKIIKENNQKFMESVVSFFQTTGTYPAYLLFAGYKISLTIVGLTGFASFQVIGLRGTGIFDGFYFVETVKHKINKSTFDTTLECTMIKPKTWKQIINK